MKKVILALLLGAAAMQSATAAIRTFEFTATVSDVFDAEYQGETTIAGPVAGTFVTAGDLLKGRFSFDDQGRDWANATDDAYGLPMTGFSYTFLSSNATVSVADTKWHHQPDYFGNSSFNIRERDFKPSVSFDINSPVNAFSWELGNGTSAGFSAMWSNGVFSYLGANVTTLTEVSPVPEPSTYAMLLLGAAAVVAGAAKRRKASASA